MYGELLLMYCKMKRIIKIILVYLVGSWLTTVLISLKNEIDKMNVNEKKHIHSLIKYMADCWKMDLSNLTDLDKKLLDIRILYPVDSNSVAFISCIILHVCIDALFSTPSRPILKEKVSDKPMDLLVLELSYYSY
jgi:hypothetical protein